MNSLLFKMRLITCTAKIEIDANDKKKLNKIIVESGYCALFEIIKGRVWWVPRHWIYLSRDYNHAGRRLICRAKFPKGFHLISGRFWYATEKIK